MRQRGVRIDHASHAPIQLGMTRIQAISPPISSLPTSQKVAIVNHALSLIVFVVCLVEFLLIRGFATSTFFLILTMVMLDVLAGFIVTIIAARKDMDFGGT